MNLYAIIILSTLIIEYALSLYADILNLSRLKSTLPEEMQGIYDPEKYKKSQEYTRVNTKFSIFTASVMLLLMLFFWFGGGFNLLDQVVRGWGLHPLLTGLLYIALLLFLQKIISLPFSLYSTFVIEARFGFNQTTPSVFISDLLKGTLLAFLLGGPILAALLAFFESAGSLAWLYAWGITTLFGFLIQLIAPTWIMPLFNKFKPLETGELKNAIMAFAQSVHFPLQNVFVIDGSRRTRKSNAFFTGFGKNKRIALFDTLIENHTTPELVSILAHEIGHYKKNHITHGFILSTIHTGLMFYLLSIFISHAGLYSAFYMEQPSLYTGFIFFGMLFAPMDFFLSLFFNMLSRKNEYEADRFAVESFKQPETMVTALKKLSVHNLANLTPHPMYTFLNYSHPPLLARIRAIRAASNLTPHYSNQG